VCVLRCPVEACKKHLTAVRSLLFPFSPTWKTSQSYQHARKKERHKFRPPQWGKEISGNLDILNNSTSTLSLLRNLQNPLIRKKLGEFFRGCFSGDVFSFISLLFRPVGWPCVYRWISGGGLRGKGERRPFVLNSIKNIIFLPHICFLLSFSPPFPLRCFVLKFCAAVGGQQKQRDKIPGGNFPLLVS